MLNNMQLIGRVGKAPDIRYHSDSTTIASFSVATTEKWTDKETGEKKEQTEWHRVVAFGSHADTVRQYVKQGDLLYVQGSLHTREYVKDGIKRYSTELRVATLKMLGSTPAMAPEHATPSVPTSADNSLPF